MGGVAAVAAVVLMAVLAPASDARARTHDCGQYADGPFRVLGLGAQGRSCERARKLLGAWLSHSTSAAGEGLPRSQRPRRWRCRRVIAWECVINGRPARLVFSFDLRRHGDLLATLDARNGSGAGAQPYADFTITVRNIGRDAVGAKLVYALPVGVAVVGAWPSQGTCAPPDKWWHVECALGPVQIGYANGARITVRVAYDCATYDTIEETWVAVSSASGDLDLANNTARSPEIDRVCPDPADGEL